MTSDYHNYSSSAGRWNRFRWAKIVGVALVGSVAFQNLRLLVSSSFDNDDTSTTNNIPAHPIRLHESNYSTYSNATVDDATTTTTTATRIINARTSSIIDVAVVNRSSKNKVNVNTLIAIPEEEEETATTWNERIQKVPNSTSLKIPTPIFLASLPKSGTTSVWRYFLCGEIPSSHLFAKLNETESLRFNGEPSILSGRCMKRNAMENRPYLEGCGNYQVWTDTGFIKGRNPALSCYYPAIEGLEELYKWYPNATLLLITRNTQAWRKSVTNWSSGTLLKRWERCKLEGFRNRTSEGMEEFYEWHKRLVRDFATSHPSLTYIEAELESLDTASILESKTGIPAFCWADCDPLKRTCAAA